MEGRAASEASIYSSRLNVALGGSSARPGSAGLSAVRGAVAPLVRRALELLAAGAGGPELADLVSNRLPAAMLPRLEPGGLAATGRPPAARGESALLVVSGPALRGALVAVILHAGGGAYTVALRAEGMRLPPELAAGGAGLDAAPPVLGALDQVGREWAAAALATLTREAEALVDDHRWWGDVGAQLMLADLVEFPVGG